MSPDSFLNYLTIKENHQNMINEGFSNNITNFSNKIKKLSRATSLVDHCEIQKSMLWVDNASKIYKM